VDSRPALAQVELFRTLTPQELESLHAKVRRRRYAKGTVIFVEGDPGVSLYVIESGRVKIVLTSPDGKELVIAVRGPGEFFGDMALLDGEPRSADAVTAENCQLLILQREDFLRFVQTHPEAATRLLAELSRRLRRTMRQQQDATLLDVSGRVARALLHLAEEQGHPVARKVDANGAADSSGAMTVDVAMTQTDLASLVGVTRESVNKWLRYYRRRGWVLWENSRLTILRPDELRKRLL
jgi:CRP-like cAMP-binding protein